MKHRIKLVLATLCVALNLASAQAPTSPVIPDHLPIGKMIIAENLAKVARIEIFSTAPSAKENFQIMVDFADVQSTEDIIGKLEGIEPSVEVLDPKDFITTTAVVYDKDWKKLFVATNSFKMEKVGYDGDGEPVYQTPMGAGFMFFELLSDPIPFPGATEAWAITFTGGWYNLQCLDGKIIVPGWMNLSGFSEVVVNGTWRYDMNTGLLLSSQDSKVKFTNVYFDGLEKVETDRWGDVLIYTQARYGYAPLVELKNQTGKFRLKFTNGEQWEDARPIAVRITTLEDRKSGREWKTYNFPEGGLELDLPVGTYYIYPEYDAKDFGWGISTSGGQG